jgi:hypothetical protein
MQSLSRRALPVRRALPGYHYFPVVGTRSRVFQPIREPDRNRKCGVEVLYQLLVRMPIKLSLHIINI